MATGSQSATCSNTKSTRFWNPGRSWSREPVRASTEKHDIGFVVDAGPTAGYGHVVRCMRLALRLSVEHRVVFYPLSETCREFIASSGFDTTDTAAFPPTVITDLREANGITAKIHRQGSRHISIHDLGLAQCRSDVAIDGSIARL